MFPVTDTGRNGTLAPPMNLWTLLLVWVTVVFPLTITSGCLVRRSNVSVVLTDLCVGITVGVGLAVAYTRWLVLSRSRARVMALLGKLTHIVFGCFEEVTRTVWVIVSGTLLTWLTCSEVP